MGHSYGVHISIKIAIDCPDRVASLTLSEPTAFYLLEPGTAFDPGYSRKAIPDLPMPTLLLTGARTTSAARGVFDAHRKLVPDSQVVEFDDLGHMGPVTHPAVVNPAIADFIGRQ